MKTAQQAGSSWFDSGTAHAANRKAVLGAASSVQLDEIVGECGLQRFNNFKSCLNRLIRGEFISTLTPLISRTVAEACGGMSMIAAKTGLKRESVSRALSATGNPRLSSLSAILEAAGLQIAVRAA